MIKSARFLENRSEASRLSNRHRRARLAWTFPELKSPVNLPHRLKNCKNKTLLVTPSTSQWAVRLMEASNPRCSIRLSCFGDHWRIWSWTHHPSYSMQFLGISRLSRAVAVCWSLHQPSLRSSLRSNKSRLTRAKVLRWTNGAISIRPPSMMSSCNNSSHLSLMLYSPLELDRANSVAEITSFCRPLRKNTVLSYLTRGAQFKRISTHKSGSSASFQISLNSKK